MERFSRNNNSTKMASPIIFFHPNFSIEKIKKQVFLSNKVNFLLIIFFIIEKKSTKQRTLPYFNHFFYFILMADFGQT